MAPVTIIALIFIALILTKLVVVSINPMRWKGVVQKFYSNPPLTMAVGFVAALLILRTLLQELTIVQIFACMTFMMALMMIQFAGLSDEIMELSDKFFEDRSLLKKVWLSIAIWVGLLVWVLVEIFI